VRRFCGLCFDDRLVCLADASAYDGTVEAGTGNQRRRARRVLALAITAVVIFGGASAALAEQHAVTLSPTRWARAANAGCAPYTRARRHLVAPRVFRALYRDIARGRRLSAAERRALPKAVAFIHRNVELNRGQERAIARLPRPRSIAVGVARLLRLAGAADRLTLRALRLFQRQRPSFLRLDRRAEIRGVRANRIARRLGAFVCAG